MLGHFYISIILKIYFENSFWKKKFLRHGTIDHQNLCKAWSLRMYVRRQLWSWPSTENDKTTPQKLKKSLQDCMVHYYPILSLHITVCQRDRDNLVFFQPNAENGATCYLRSLNYIKSNIFIFQSLKVCVNCNKLLFYMRLPRSKNY